jgi:primosomal protein N' (replication factor Y)
LYIKVAVPRPVDSFFDYEYDENHLGQIKAGDLVQVPFGRSKLIACVMETSLKKPSLPEKITLKKVSAKIDSEFSMTEDVFSLCRFGSEYYQYPIGEAFFVATAPKPEGFLKTRAEKAHLAPPVEIKLNLEQAFALRTIE